MAGGEDLARHRLLQHSFERSVALVPQIGDQTDPIEVHVDAERRRRSIISETALLAADFGKIETGTPQFFRDGHRQIAGIPQILEILVEEPVLAVVTAASLGELAQRLVGQNLMSVMHRSLPGSAVSRSYAAMYEGKSSGPMISSRLVRHRSLTRNDETMGGPRHIKSAATEGPGDGASHRPQPQSGWRNRFWRGCCGRAWR